MSESEFLQNPTIKRAFVRSLEIIGEATKNIPKDFKLNYAEVDWKNMARMREKLIHHYFGVNYSIVWDVVNNEIPALHEKILKLIEFEENNKD